MCSLEVLDVASGDGQPVGSCCRRYERINNRHGIVGWPMPPLGGNAPRYGESAIREGLLHPSQPPFDRCGLLQVPTGTQADDALLDLAKCQRRDVELTGRGVRNPAGHASRWIALADLGNDVGVGEVGQGQIRDVDARARFLLRLRSISSIAML